jgi:hypothetical protein
MKNRKMLFAALFAAVAAAGIAAKIVWPEAVNAILDDLYTWFRSRRSGWL